jgi:hypothetical protein
MKRGLITWDKTELPLAAFESRLETVRQTLMDLDLPAMVVYTDIWRSNQGRHFSNFMPYWNRALIVLPREGAPVLLCALSPRVYPWIRSVTILDEIRPSANLTQKLLEMCAEKSWKRIGVLDLFRLPADLNLSDVEAVNIAASKVWPVPDEWEIAMHRRAAGMARQVIADEFPRATGCVDHEFAGRLERSFRRAGAEDLVILLTDGQTVPMPPNGGQIGEDSSVLVALEYRGHWIRLSRPHPSCSIAGAPQSRLESFETLSGPYPYESCERSDIAPGTLFALHVELHSNGRRLFYCDTALQGQTEAELL